MNKIPRNSVQSFFYKISSNCRHIHIVGRKVCDKIHPLCAKMRAFFISKFILRVHRAGKNRHEKRYAYILRRRERNSTWTETLSMTPRRNFSYTWSMRTLLRRRDAAKSNYWSPHRRIWKLVSSRQRQLDATISSRRPDRSPRIESR